MPKFCELLNELKQAPVFLIVIIEVIFLCLLFYVFKADFPLDLRSVIKDAFIGWNGALALAINVSVKKQEASLCPPEQPEPTTPTQQ